MARFGYGSLLAATACLTLTLCIFASRVSATPLVVPYTDPNTHLIGCQAIDDVVINGATYDITFSATTSDSLAPSGFTGTLVNDELVYRLNLNPLPTYVEAGGTSASYFEVIESNSTQDFYSIFNKNGTAGSWSESYGTTIDALGLFAVFTPDTSVPEPHTVALILAGLGLVCLIGVLRKQRGQIKIA